MDGSKTVLSTCIRHGACRSLLALVVGRASVLAVSGLLALNPVAPPAVKALFVYTAKGSSVSGSLGGTPFTNASWEISAAADESRAANLVFSRPSLGVFDFWLLTVQPRVVIYPVGSAAMEASLLPQGSFRWILLSGLFPVGPSPKLGFVYTTPTFSPETAAGLFGVPELYTNLSTNVSLSGPSVFEANTYPTTSGDLVISSTTNAAGTFTAYSTVPAPLPLFGAAAALGWSRRLRRRVFEGSLGG